MTAVPSVSIVVPVYNEAKNIEPLVSEIDLVLNGFDYEIIFVDDGSMDDSQLVIKKVQESYARVLLSSHEQNRGIFSAWKTGMSAATKKMICLIDADLQNDPRDIIRMHRTIDFYNCDLVQGGRSIISDRQWGKRVQSRCLSFLLNLSMSSTYADPKSGFILMKAYVSESILTTKWPDFFYPHTYIRYMATHLGYTCRDVETLFRDRLHGQSSISAFPLNIVIKAVIDLFVGAKLKKQENFTTQFSSYIDSVTNQQSFRDPEMSAKHRLWFFVYRLFWPLHKWNVSARVLKQFQLLRRSQNLSNVQLREWQRKRLQKLLLHAYSNTEYYRDVFDRSNVDPTDFHDLEDLNKFPILTKKNVRENIHFGLFATGHDKSKMNLVRTSGSTGEPFRIYCDTEQLEMRMAATMRGYWWAGWRPMERQLRLWHQKIGMSFVEIMREKIDAVLMRRRFIPAFEMSPKSCEEFIANIAKQNPVLIDGYAESLEYLSDTSEMIKNKTKSVQAVVSSAQELSESARKKIENNLGAKVFDKYGAREFSGIAYQMDAGENYQCVSETYYVEILKDGKPAKPGEIGEVYITDLVNWNFPIIRYQIGDLAGIPKTKTNSPFFELSKIYGRTKSIVRFSDGSWQPSSFFLHLLKEFEGEIARFQVVQKTVEVLTVKVVRGPFFSDETEKRVIDNLREFCPSIKIEVQLVEEIPLGVTGKYLPVVSELN